MSFQGRSPDDLPLAAYSTGVVAEEPDEEPVAEPQHPLSQQEAIALAMGIDAPGVPAPEKAEPERVAVRRRPGRPRLSLPRPTLPRPALPGLPRLGFRGGSAAAAESPFHLEPSALSMTVAHVPAVAPTATPTATPAAAPGVMPAVTPAVRSRSIGVTRPTWLPDLGDLGARLRNPRTAVRDPRVLLGGLIGIGVVLLGVSLLGGGAAGGPGPAASESPGPGIGVPAGPGPATVEITGRVDGSFTLTGTTGFGKPADGQLASTWADSLGTTLSISGRVGSVTRTTSRELVLSVTLLVNGAPVSFVSEDGECTVGMAEKMATVAGSFVCRELTSVDGRMELKITGNYET